MRRRKRVEPDDPARLIEDQRPDCGAPPWDSVTIEPAERAADGCVDHDLGGEQIGS